MKLFLRKHKDYYLPDTDDDFKKSQKVDFGGVVEVEVWKQRNVQLHRKYFAFLNCTLYHMPESVPDEFRNIDNLRRYITINTGRYDLVPSLKGKPIPQAKSISFKNMDDEDFKKLYSDSIDFVLKYFLKGISLEEFKNDILNFI